MSVVRYRFFLSAIVSCLIAPSSTSAQTVTPPPKYVTATDKNGIELAMKVGDSARLKDIAGQDLPPETHEYALAAYYRSVFDLDKSDEHLKKCLVIAKDMLDRNPVPVLLCGSMFAGNAYIRADINRWAAATAHTRDAVVPVVAGLTRTTNFVLPGISDIDLSPYVDEPALSGPSSSAGTYVIPRIIKAENDHSDLVQQAADGAIQATEPYLVKVAINGVTSALWLDTGTSTTAMGSAAAHTSRMKPYSAYFAPLTNVFTGQTVPVHLAIANTLILGGDGFPGLELNHVPVVTGDDIHMAAVGMDVLSRLGPVLIKEREVIVHPAGGVDCNQELHVASAPRGSMAVVLTMVVNGVAQPTLLDTGDNGYLSATAAAGLPSSGVVRSGERFTFQGVGRNEYEIVDVSIGDAEVNQKMAIRYYRSRTSTTPYVLGLAALRDYDIFLDFKARKACILEKK